MKFKIAVVQFKVRKVSADENLKRAEEFIKKASSSKSNLIVFPEDFITRILPVKKEFLRSKDYIKQFQKLAKKYKIDIVPGSVIEKDRSYLYNTCYYIDLNGKILSKYRKVHLWSTERKLMKPGHKASVLKTRYGKIGFIICWDLMFPDIFKKMSSKGVEVIICPSFWCKGDAGKGMDYSRNSEVKLVDSLCVDRAFEEEIILVYCNAAGKFKKDISIGRSQITVPFMGAIKKLNHNREEMFVQEVDTSILKDAEKVYKVKEDSRKKLLN